MSKNRHGSHHVLEDYKPSKIKGEDALRADPRSVNSVLKCATGTLNKLTPTSCPVCSDGTHACQHTVEKNIVKKVVRGTCKLTASMTEAHIVPAAQQSRSHAKFVDNLAWRLKC